MSAAAAAASAAAPPAPAGRAYKGRGSMAAVDREALRIVEESPILRTLGEILEGPQTRTLRLWIKRRLPPKPTPTVEAASLTLVGLAAASIMGSHLYACPKELTEQIDVDSPSLMTFGLSTCVAVASKQGGGKDSLSALPLALLTAIFDGKSTTDGGSDHCSRCARRRDAQTFGRCRVRAPRPPHTPTPALPSLLPRHKPAPLASRPPPAFPAR